MGRCCVIPSRIIPPKANFKLQKKNGESPRTPLICTNSVTYTASKIHLLPMSKLTPGDPAPDFALPNQDGQTIRLHDYQGKSSLVLFFYPKDESPGCTMEVCSFRDQYEAFTEAGAEVIGISGDSVASHKSFASQRRLPFQLLSDRRQQVSKQYGVKSSMMGLLRGRETFVIDKAGIIRYRFASQMDIFKHIQASLQIIKDLAKAPNP